MHLVLLDTTSLNITVHYADIEMRLHHLSNHYGNNPKIKKMATLSRSMAEEFKDDIVGLLQTILEEQKLNLNQVDTLVVITGPGSYTGLRMGVAAGNGIAIGNCLHNCVKVVGINLFSLLYQVALNQKLVLNNCLNLILNSTGKDSYYGQLFNMGKCSAPREIKLENPYDMIAEMWHETTGANNQPRMIESLAITNSKDILNIMVEDSVTASSLIKELKVAPYSVKHIALDYATVGVQEIVKAAGELGCRLLDNQQTATDNIKFTANHNLRAVGQVVYPQQECFLTTQYIKPPKVTLPKKVLS